MKELLLDVWNRDKRGFLRILFLNIAVSLTGGISIVMLVPMLGLLNISEGAGEALSAIKDLLRYFSPNAQLVTIVGMYFVLIVSKACLNWLLKIRQSEFLEKYSLELREQLYDTIATAKWEELAAARQSDTIDLFTAQCSQVSQGVSMLVSLLTAVVSAMVSVGIALWLSIPVTVFVLVFGAAFIFVFRNLLKESKRFGDEMIRINRSMYAELFNQLRSVKEVRSYGVRKEHMQLFHEISRSSKDAKLKYMRQQAFPTMLYSVAAAGMIGIIFVISTLGFRLDTARLVVLIYVFTRLWPLLTGFISKITAIQTILPAHEKLTEAFRTFTPEGIDGDESILPFEHTIEFRSIRFAYRGSEEEVLKNVNFTLEKGSITALVGRSGAGKTTIADLLLGFLEPTGGEILIDGVPLTAENLSGWHKALGYIPQEPLILNASVRENLLRFHPNATEADLIEALKKARAWEVVENLPQGLDTLLGDAGIRLSGGERQRIVLARVLMNSPRLIVMDEATSAMDYESEAAVRAAIRNLKDQVTVLVIAHRLATVRTAEYGLVLENGTIVEKGELKQLISTPDGYLNNLIQIE